jgi:FkbM family methyltransferase
LARVAARDRRADASRAVRRVAPYWILMKTPKRCTLPNGWEVAYRSTAEMKILLDEFVEDAYGVREIRLEDGACIFDVGANIGLFIASLPASLRKAKVYAFEPIPETVELLRENLARNSRLDVDLRPIGLSSEPSEAEFVYYPRMSVKSSMCAVEDARTRRETRQFILEEMRSRSRILRFLVDSTPLWIWFCCLETIRWLYHRRKTVRCPLRTVSSIIDEEGIQQIDLLKIDVEGAEGAVLAGIREDHWPCIMQAVVETHYGAAQAEDVAAGLRRRGFDVSIAPSIAGFGHLRIVIARRADHARPMKYRGVESSLLAT